MNRQRAVLFVALALVLALHVFLYSYEKTSFHSLLSFQSAMKEPAASLKPRLEFFHIPKTGGTMLEALAGKNNVTWGACHFQSIPLASKNKKWKQMSPWPSCPVLEQNVTFPLNSQNYWHLPLCLLPQWLDYDPYDIGVHPTLVKAPKRFFAVVRNPYLRIISLYYYVNFKTKTSIVHDPKRLEDFVLGKVQDSCALVQKCIESKKSCHGLFWWGTQYDYIYYKKQRMIHHVLRYETLQQDFNALSAEYELNFTIADKEPLKRQRLLTVANLSDDSLGFINRVFRKDFEFGYEMIQPKTA